MAKKRPAAKTVTKGKAAPDKPPEVVKLPMSSIDMSICHRVREARDEDTVKEYARTVAEWCDTAPIDVYEGGGKRFGADGGHRYSAAAECGHKSILCRVVKCGSADEALKAALRHAYGANANHGRQRTPADKRKLVKDAILNPDYATLSDRDIATLCKVSREVVSDVRQILTNAQQLQGEAASTHPDRLSKNPKCRPGAKAEAPAEGGRAATNPTGDAEGVDTAATSPQAATHPESGREATPDGSAEPEPAKPAERMLDARGRVIPTCLVPLFKEGRKFVSDLRGTASEMLEAVRQSGQEPWGEAFLPLMPNFERDMKILVQDVRASIPHICCPHINAEGVHELGGKCKVCIDNRGWISRHNWHHQPDSIKKLIDEHAAEKPQPEADGFEM